MLNQMQKSETILSSTSRMQKVLRLIVRSTVALMLMCVQTTFAEPIQWRTQQMTMVAREQPLRDFLQDLFSQQGISISISDAVPNKPVNGSFNDRPQKVFDSIVKSFGLLTFFDGSVVYVYSPSEATSKTLTIDSVLIKNVMQTMSAMEVFDNRNTFKAYPREGIITLNGSKRFIEHVEEIVRSVTAQSISGPARFKIYTLKHAWAYDVTVTYGGQQRLVPGVATLLKNLIASAPKSLERNDQRRNANTLDKLNGKGLASGFANPGKEDQNSTDSLNSGVQSASASGPARVEADQRTNSVIVRDTADRMPFYEELINQLDVEPLMVEIEAAIIDVNADRAQDLGVNWRYIKGNQQVLFGQGNASDLALQPGQTVTPQGLGGFISATLIGNAGNFIARINALASEGDGKIVSRPKVLVMSNLEANIEDSQSIYVRVSGYQNVDLFNIVTGTSFRVTPRVLRDGTKNRINLLISIKDGNPTSATVDQIPVVNDKVINTQILIPENTSALIGGLVREENVKEVSKVPGLGDVPLFGWLFKRENTQVRRTQRLFMITPRIITAEMLADGAASANEQSGLITPDGRQSNGTSAERKN